MSDPSDMSVRKRRSGTFIRRAVLVGIVAAGLLWFREESLPIHNGRTVAQWFQAFIAPGGHWQTIFMLGNKEATQAIVVELGEDALPFLIGVAGSRAPLPETKAYEKALNYLPKAVVKKLPKPRPDSRNYAIRLIGAIGTQDLHQKWRYRGDPERKTQTAVAALKKALRNKQLRQATCMAIEEIGPAAKDTIPELLALLSAQYSDHVIQGGMFGAVGGLRFSASNAVPILTRIVEDQGFDYLQRWKAAFTLAEIGGPAQSAGPAIWRLMVELIPIASNPTNQSLGFLGSLESLGYEHILAHTGGTPPEAVPELERISQEGTPYQRALAPVALWHAEPGNQRYREMVAMLLRAPLETSPDPNAGPWAGVVVFALTGHATAAIVFEPEIRALAESAAQPAQSNARRALERMRPELTSHPVQGTGGAPQN